MLSKAEIAVIKYQIDREKVANAKGHYRCDNQLKGESVCASQCIDCNKYYENKLIEK